jgi:hypothetical protein
MGPSNDDNGITPYQGQADNNYFPEEMNVTMATKN